MRTLRIKLTVPPGEDYRAPRATFRRIATVHEDQAIFQVNETTYADEDTWGFAITYRSNREFVRSTSASAVEAAMAAAAPNGFERRIDPE